MGSDKQHNKRKQPPDGIIAPQPKKSSGAEHRSHRSISATEQELIRERHRQAVSVLFEAHDKLTKSGQQQIDEAAFQVLLDGAEGGTCAQRVAARLIPRFAALFPQKLEDAAASLITIATAHSTSKDPDAVRALSKAARPEALAGLGRVCETAASITSSASGAVIAKAAEALMRRLSSELSRSSASTADGGNSETAAALQSLCAAFHTSTRVVLATCLQSFKSQDGKTRDGSRFFMSHLLAPREAAREAAAATANGRANSSEPGEAPPDTCLAATVLRGQLDTQQWLRNTAPTMQSDPPKHRAKDALALLERLLKVLPPPPSEPQPLEPELPPHIAAALKAASSAASAQAPPLPTSSASAPLPPPETSAVSSVQPRQAAAPKSDSDDMDLEEGQLADSPARIPPMPPPPAAITVPPPAASPAAAPSTSAPPASAPPPLPSGPAPAAARKDSGGPSTPAAAVRSGSAAKTSPATAPGPAIPATPQTPRQGGPPRPGGPLCRVGPTLWLGGLAPRIGEKAIRAVCSRVGEVTRVSFPPCPHRDEALVTFVGMREAAVAYEQLCGAMPWGPGPRLDVQFCTDSSVAEGSRSKSRWQQEQQAQPAYVWVAGISNAAAEAEAMAALKAAGVPPASGVLRVAGNRPGLMMQFPELQAGDAAVAALRNHGKPGAPAQPAASQPADPPVDPCAVSVSQISPAVHEREVLQAFSRFGDLTRWHLSRAAGTATICYAAPAFAASAARALDGAPIGPTPIRVSLQGKDPPARQPAAPAGPSPARAAAASPAAAAIAAKTPPMGASTPSPGQLPPGAVANGGPPSGGARRRRWEERPPPQSSPLAAAPMHGAAPAATPTLPSGPPPPPPRTASSVHTPAPQGPPAPQLQPPLPSPPAAVQSPPQRPPPAPAAAASQQAAAQAAPASQPSWTGQLGRPSVQPCSVVCIDGPQAGSAADSLPGSEPHEWPPLLEVKARIPTTMLMGQKLPAVPEAERAVRRLTAGPNAADRHAFVRFMQYLSDKQRAGVVEMVPGSGSRPRTMYLIPPSRTVCDELQVTWEPQEILVAVVIFTPPK